MFDFVIIEMRGTEFRVAATITVTPEGNEISLGPKKVFLIS